MLSVPVARAYFDGNLVPVVCDARVATSFCPPLWFHGGPSHILCEYMDGFSFSRLLSLSPSPSIGCLVLGRDWIDSVVVARRGA